MDHSSVLNFGFFLAVLVACKTATPATEGSAKAVQGLPQVYPGRLGPGFTEILLYEVGPDLRPIRENGAEKIRRKIMLRFEEGAVLLTDESGTEFEHRLTPNPNVTYSYNTAVDSTGANGDAAQDLDKDEKEFNFSKEVSLISNTLWTCGDAERLVGKTAGASLNELSDDDDCYIEINTTGNDGVNISIIGAPRGRGIDRFVNSNKPKLPAPGYRAPQDLKNKATLTPTQRVNAMIDHDFAFQALKSIASEFKQNEGDSAKARNTCLKNQRAIGWTDIQAHYYCQLPLDMVDSSGKKIYPRSCYAKHLVRTVAEVAANKFDLDSLQYNSLCKAPTVDKVNPFCVAYSICLQDRLPYFDQATKDGQLHQIQFVYLMFLKQGMFDFNIEAENRVINQFYRDTQPSGAASERPRRLLDTWPNWLPDQPRYNQIRETQLKSLIEMGGNN